MWSALLVGVGLSWAAQGVIDPLRPTGRLLGPLLALLGLVLGSRTRVRWKNLLFPTILAMTFGVSAHIQAEFRADSGAYFAYLRSLVFDGDLDFANEWGHWGWERGRRTRTGMVRNGQSVGPAVLWSPAYSATHAYLVVDRKPGEGLATVPPGALPRGVRSHPSPGTRGPADRHHRAGSEGLESQVVTVVLNGQVLTTARLPDRWKDMKLTMGARYLVSGENALCLRFSDALPAQSGNGPLW